MALEGAGAVTWQGADATGSEKERPVVRIADGLLSGALTRSQAADAAQRLLLSSVPSSAVDRRGLALLASADRHDTGSRWVIDLATVAEWRSALDDDPREAHWWSISVPGLTTTDPLRADEELREYVQDCDDLPLTNPRNHFTPSWAPDHAHLVLKCLQLATAQLDVDEKVVAATTIEQISEWLRWRQPEAIHQVVLRIESFIEAVNSADANALFMARDSPLQSGEAISKTLSELRKPVACNEDLRELVSSALQSNEDFVALDIRLHDASNRHWVFSVIVDRSDRQAPTVLYRGLGRA